MNPYDYEQDGGVITPAAPPPPVPLPRTQIIVRPYSLALVFVVVFGAVMAAELAAMLIRTYVGPWLVEWAPWLQPAVEATGGI
jgi:hypothetical protein